MANQHIRKEFPEWMSDLQWKVNPGRDYADYFNKGELKRMRHANQFLKVKKEK